MPSGNTVTDALDNSIPTIIASARKVREQKGGMPSLVDKQTLAPNTGKTWNEVDYAKLADAQDITETTVLDNPQQLVDTNLPITPTIIGIQTLITDEVGRRLSKKALAQHGGLAQNSVERRKDKDGLTAIDGFTTQLGSAGASLVSGLINAAMTRVTSNTTEPAPDGPVYGVFHGFQLKDLHDEILALSSGALPAQLEAGASAQVFQNGFRGTIDGVQLHANGNLTINSADDAKGGVFHKLALVLVQGRMPRAETRREPHIGGGATSVFHYDQYAYGERSAGNWGYEIISDATAPTT